jgi:hypothetical protein
LELFDHLGNEPWTGFWEKQLNKKVRPVPTYANRFTKQKGKFDAICSHYSYSGHLVDKCFQLIAYLSWMEGAKRKKDLLPHYILAKKFKGYTLQTILLFWN